MGGSTVQSKIVYLGCYMKRLLFSLAIVFSLTSPCKADIVIAMVAPLTGSYAVFGEQMRHGTEQAVADINAKGGIHGEKINLKEFDDACDPKQAVTVANEIASQDIKLVVGHWCSGAGLAAKKVYVENDILIISLIGHPQFTEEKAPLVFRVGMRNDIQGKTIGKFILKNLKNKKVAILNDTSAYGNFLASSVKETLNTAGKNEILFDSFTAGQKDYSALVTHLKQLKTDVLVIGGYHTETGLIARQLNDQSAKIQIIGGTALMTDELWAITGKQGEGILMTFGPDPRKHPQAKEAVLALKRSGYDPEGYTMYAYGAAQVLVAAISDSKDATPENVATALRSHPFPTVLGTLTFDDKGDIQNPEMAIYRWHDGGYYQLSE